MSHTTRCPACGTIFRVAADQLKVSDGWVRCGHCADVFDATLHLAPWPPAISAASRVAEDGNPHRAFASPSAVLGSVASVRAHSAAGAFSVSLPPVRVQIKDGFRADLTGFAAGRPSDAVAAPVDAPDASQNTPRHSEGDGYAPGRQSWSDAASERPDRRAPEHHPNQPIATSPAARPAAADEPGFLRQARRQAFWRSPWMRGLLSVSLLLLLTLLAAQWGVYDRDRLASRHPALAPVLAQLCLPLGCRIAPPRDIDAVVIDSSALVRRLADFYAFDVVLKNTATMAVAMPALELSLTDAQDRVIARRVFLPRELPGAPEQLAPQSSLSLNLRLTLASSGTDALPMTGYRALVFYP